MPIDTGTTYRSGSGLHVGTKHVHHALSQSDGAGAIAALGRAGFYEGHGGSPRDRIVRKLTLGSDIPAMVAADPRLRSYDHIGDVSCQGKVLHIKIPDGEAQLALGSEQDCADAKTAIDYEGWARQSTACDLGISAMEETKDFRVHVILPEGQSMHQCDNPPNENCHPWCESRPSE